MSQQFKELDIVWAKLCGHPWWPAYVRSTNINSKYEVVFLSDFSLSYLPVSKLKKYEKISKKREGDRKSMIVSIKRANSILEGNSTIVEEYYKQYKKGLTNIKTQCENKIETRKDTTSTLSKNKEALTDCSDIVNKSTEINCMDENDSKFNKINDNKQIIKFEKNKVEIEDFEENIKSLEQRLLKLFSNIEVKLEVEQTIDELCDISSHVFETPAYDVYNSKIVNLLYHGLQSCKLHLKNGKHAYMEIHEILKVLIDQILSFLNHNGYDIELKAEKYKSALLNLNDVSLNRNYEFEMKNNYIQNMAHKNNHLSKDLKHDEKDTNVSTESIELNSILVRRVRVKLAKTLYLHKDKEGIQKKQCKAMAEKIDEILQKMCISEEDYKTKAVALVNNLEKSRDRMRIDIFKNIKDKKDQLLVKNINKLISN